MGLISRQPGKKQEDKEDKEDSGQPIDPDAEATSGVEVTIEGPDKERLEGLIDMSAVADMVRRRASQAEPPVEE